MNASGIKLRLAALSRAYELKADLERVIACPEYGPGSCPAEALELLDEAIAMLEPCPPGADEDDDPGAPRCVTWLRLGQGRL